MAKIQSCTVSNYHLDLLHKIETAIGFDAGVTFKACFCTTINSHMNIKTPVESSGHNIVLRNNLRPSQLEQLDSLQSMVEHDLFHTFQGPRMKELITRGVSKERLASNMQRIFDDAQRLVGITENNGKAEEYVNESFDEYTSRIKDRDSALFEQDLALINSRSPKADEGASAHDKSDVLLAGAGDVAE